MVKKRTYKLTEMQKRFCDEYINCLNGSEAARKAGYTQKNPDAIAIQLLRKTHVLDYLKQLQNKASKKLNISRDEILTRYWKLADNAKKDSDKLKALELTAKMLGFNEPDKLDLSNKDGSLTPTINFVMNGVIKDAD